MSVTAQRAGWPCIANRCRDRRPDAFQIIQVFTHGHLQPETQQHPQLVVNNIGINFRRGDFLAGGALRQVERRASRFFRSGHGIGQERQPEPIVLGAMKDFEQLGESLLGREALGRVGRDQHGENAPKDSLDGRDPIVQKSGALAGEHRQQLLARLGRAPGTSGARTSSSKIIQCSDFPSSSKCL